MIVRNSGFTLVELIAVLTIIAILGVSAVQGAMPTLSFQMQSSRDQVVTAFFAAQQRAMAQTNPVRLILTPPNEIDIREDRNDDSDFAEDESIAIGGIRYPIEIQPNQRISQASFDFDRLGSTSANTLVLSQDGVSVNINISASGYVY